MGTYSFRKVRKYIRGEKAPLGSAFFKGGFMWWPLIWQRLTCTFKGHILRARADVIYGTKPPQAYLNYRCDRCGEATSTQMVLADYAKYECKRTGGEWMPDKRGG